MTRSGGAPRVLLVDNYDSYTYNLAHLLASASGGKLPIVVRADAYTSLATAADALGPFDAVVISPGPGSPHNARDVHSLSADAIQQRRLPVLGVCLGHQLLCAKLGATVTHAEGGPAHGVVSDVTLTSAALASPIWRDVPSLFRATRYHSLAVDPTTLPSQLVADAWADAPTGRVLMAVHHTRFPLFGVQFHPESVASESGTRIAANFFALAAKLRAARAIPWRVLRSPAVVPSALRIADASSRHCPPRLTRLRVVTRRLTSTEAKPESIYAALYADQTPCFWLDSSSSHKRTKSGCTVDLSSSRIADQNTDEDEDSTEECEEGAQKMRTPRGRFSIMGDARGPLSEIVTYSVDDQTVRVARRCKQTGTLLQHKERRTIFEYLGEQLAHRRAPSPDDLPIDMNGGYVGFLGYELKNEVPGVQLHRHRSSLPDAWFIFADRVVVFDHETGDVFLVALISDNPDQAADGGSAERWFFQVERQLASLDEDCSTGDECPFETVGAPLQEKLSFTLERNKNDYQEDIEECLREIIAGESYEVCLTNRLRTRVHAPDARQVYGALRSVNPAPYSALLRLGSDVAVCSSSPERFMRISADGVAESKPIKGTRRRDSSPTRDQQLRSELASSVKDRSENLMIVDLVRNDLGRTCAPGTVRVPHLMRVETFASVHQLVSTVRGQLAKGRSCVDCVRTAYPMGSMTGAPKARTLDIIDRVEHSARGVYSGSIGYFAISGAADLNVVIRTAVLNGSDIEVGVGGAIVALSDPDDEFDEIITKGAPIMKAISLALTGSTDFELLT